MQQKIKKYAICTTAIIIIGIAIYMICTMCGTSGLRRDVMRQCGTGMDCKCMANIIRYRMTNDELRAFGRFMNAMHTRTPVNILEFTDEQTATRIFNVVSICRQKTESESPNTKTKGK